MDWKKHLKLLEENKQWDTAIEFMQNQIKQNSDDMDTYIFMNYLLINLLAQEDYDRSKEQYYWELAKYYFDESYTRFSNDPEYLYITGKMAVMGEWFFGIDDKFYEQMIEKASQLDPKNYLYKENQYYALREKNPRDPELINYCKLILSESSPIKAQLESKGSVGEYILGMKENWCTGVLENAGEVVEA